MLQSLADIKAGVASNSPGFGRTVSRVCVGIGAYRIYATPRLGKCRSVASEAKARQEFIPDLDELTVEHVLPQGWKAEDWPMPADTSEAREARQRLLHSIGNLTPVTQGFNSSLSNVAFRLKRPEIAASSSLMVNAYFQKFSDADAWDETTIVARAGALFERARVVWPYPA